MAISPVQAASSTSITSPFNITLGSNVTPGNAVVIVDSNGSAVNGGLAIASISGGGITNWQLVVAKQNVSNITAAIWYGTGSVGGSLTLTINRTGTAGSSPQCTAVEFSGIGGLDLVASQDNVSSTSAPCPNIAPHGTADLFVACIATIGSTVSSGPTNSYTAMGATSLRGMGGYLVGSGLTAESTSFTLAGAAISEAVAAAFCVPSAPNQDKFVSQAVKRSAFRMQRAASGLFTPRRERIILPRIALAR